MPLLKYDLNTMDYIVWNPQLKFTSHTFLPEMQRIMKAPK